MCFDEAVGFQIASPPFPQLNLDGCSEAARCLFVISSARTPAFCIRNERYVTGSVGGGENLIFGCPFTSTITGSGLSLRAAPTRCAVRSLLSYWWAMSWEDTGWYLPAARQGITWQRWDLILTKDEQRQQLCSEEFCTIGRPKKTKQQNMLGGSAAFYMQGAEGNGKHNHNKLAAIFVQSSNYTHTMQGFVLDTLRFPRRELSWLTLNFLLSNWTVH